MIKKIFNKLKLILFLFINRIKLKNKFPTIICNNCVGGIIYHELKLKFCSPTINLFIPNYDFIKYVNNIEAYSNCQLIEDKSTTKYNYPVGILKNQLLGNITIHFMHYSSFEEAKQKWIERTKRISLDNIYIILDIGPSDDLDLINLFDRITFKNKIALISQNIIHKNCFGISCYNDNWHPGQILEYNKNTGQRFLHEWDFVKFLNQKAD